MKDESLAASQNAADKSVVLMEDDGLLLPLDPSAKVLVVSPGKLYHDPASGWMNAVGMTMGEALEKHHGNVTKIELFYPPDVFYFDQVQSEAGAHDIILFATLNAHYSEMHVEFAQAVADIGKPVIAVALGVPYDAADFTGYEAFVAVMGQRSVSLEAAAKFLTGKIGANGTLPVEMP
ncbi:MAG: hypothetical protein FJ088_13355 [Deltaproteobacteria bacterium]|nr:hypothetical protein [Deltaproteobacteria bacterium]